MEKSNIIPLISKKFLSGRFSVETEEKVQRWIMKEENAEEKEKASLEYWNELDTEADSKTYSALERVNLRTGYNKEHLENIVLYHKFVRIVAVVIPICLLAGGLLYYIPSENEQIEISTAYGEQKRLVLPDSSEVWLNAGSTITYPKTFTKENRVVTLDGEAYFSVRKDDAKPFIVETSQLSVKVLGTKFNVKAYANDANITTTLTSGKVEVSTQSRPPQTLKPNEQLTYDKSTILLEQSVNKAFRRILAATWIRQCYASTHCLQRNTPHKWPSSRRATCLLCLPLAAPLPETPCCSPTAYLGRRRHALHHVPIAAADKAVSPHGSRLP